LKGIFWECAGETISPRAVKKKTKASDARLRRLERKQSLIELDSTLVRLISVSRSIRADLMQFLLPLPLLSLRSQSEAGSFIHSTGTAN
jgi:hypothetical protein